MRGEASIESAAVGAAVGTSRARHVLEKHDNVEPAVKVAKSRAGAVAISPVDVIRRAEYFPAERQVVCLRALPAYRKDGQVALPRVVRGGSWNFDAANLRSADRSSYGPRTRQSNLGFRLAK